jgi:hypothetical protein
LVGDFFEARIGTNQSFFDPLRECIRNSMPIIDWSVARGKLWSATQTRPKVRFFRRLGALEETAMG